MADEARGTAELVYVETEPSDRARTTAELVYTEIQPGESSRTTAELALVEVSKDHAPYLTAVLAYVEVRIPRYSPSAFWVNYQEPPVYARPDRIHPPVVRYPEPKARYAFGRPARAIGQPYAVIGRGAISQEGLNWWQAFFTSASDLKTEVRVNLYDPLANSWRSGSGFMWRPSFQSKGSTASTYYDFTIRLTGLEFEN